MFCQDMRKGLVTPPVGVTYPDPVKKNYPEMLDAQTPFAEYAWHEYSEEHAQPEAAMRGEPGMDTPPRSPRRLGAHGSPVQLARDADVRVGEPPVIEAGMRAPGVGTPPRCTMCEMAPAAPRRSLEFRCCVETRFASGESRRGSVQGRGGRSGCSRTA